jgi:HlyD family secretion protein
MMRAPLGAVRRARLAESFGLRRFLLWTTGLLAMAAIAFGAFRYAYPEYRFIPGPKYRTATVSEGRIESVVNSTGTIKPVRSVMIGAFVSGPIQEIYVDFNSVVKENDLLARIDPRLLQAVVDRDEANLAAQKAELDRINALLLQAIRNEERAKKLQEVREDYVSGVEMDQYRFARESLEAQLALAQAAILQAEASLKNSQANLGYTEIRSPVDGIVIERKVDVGQTVAASFQTPEMFVVAPDMEKEMHVFASVDEADIGEIMRAQAQDQPVKFTVDAYPEDIFEGKVYQIRKSSTTTQNVVTYPVVISAPNPDLKLLPGMTANISFQIEVKEKVKRLPMAAIRYFPPVNLVRTEDRHYIDGQTPMEEENDENNRQISASEKVQFARNRMKRVVWVEEKGGLLRAVPVVLGLTDNQHAEIIEGELEVGQKVVIGVSTAGAAGS